MHPEHKASVVYKQLSSAWLMLRAADLLHSMDMTQIFKIARSLSCGHSLTSPSFCVCLLQLKRWLVSDYTISRFFTSNSGHDFAMYTFRHIGTSAPSGRAYVAPDRPDTGAYGHASHIQFQFICACFHIMIERMCNPTRQNAPKISASNLGIRVCAHTSRSDLCWKKVESYLQHDLTLHKAQHRHTHADTHCHNTSL